MDDPWRFVHVCYASFLLLFFLKVYLGTQTMINYWGKETFVKKSNEQFQGDMLLCCFCC